MGNADLKKIEKPNSKPIKGAEIAIKCLEREGIKQIFAYPGGASMEFHQALCDSPIDVILPRHEQGGAFAAGGFARATGHVGVCMATSGPGATNLMFRNSRCIYGFSSNCSINRADTKSFDRENRIPGNRYGRNDASNSET